MTVTKLSNRAQHLVGSARILFNENGFHAVGIDWILQEAGVAKMTLYNNFGSKDQLIVEVLRQDGADRLDWIKKTSMEALEQGKHPVEALFSAHEEWFKETSFRGSLHARAATEFPEPRHPVHMAAAEFFSELMNVLEVVVKDAGLRETRSLAGALMIFLIGASTVAASTGATIAARSAKLSMMQLFELAETAQTQQVA